MADQFLESYGRDMSLILKIPEPIGMDLAHAFARHLHGHATADTLGVGRRWIRHLFPIMLLNNRMHGWWRSVSPHARAQAIEQAVTNFHGLLVQVEGDTAYQTHLSK